jgi:hypothetical protein
MSVTDLEALARAYHSDDGLDPEILVLGHGLPDSPYDHPSGWNAILRLGSFGGSEVRFYSPRAWSYDGEGHAPGYTLHYGEEQTTDEDVYVEFDLDLPEAFIDRIVFLEPCNDGDALPAGAEFLTDSGIMAAPQPVSR